MKKIEEESRKLAETGYSFEAIVGYLALYFEPIEVIDWIIANQEVKDSLEGRENGNGGGEYFTDEEVEA